MANIDAYSAAESWIKLNLKEDPNQQLPKHGCYMAYVKCMLNQNILTIPNYDFGKIVKCLFRNVRSSGPRGSNSNYCSGITLSSSSIPGNPSSYQIPPPHLQAMLGSYPTTIHLIRACLGSYPTTIHFCPLIRGVLGSLPTTTLLIPAGLDSLQTTTPHEREASS